MLAADAVHDRVQLRHFPRVSVSDELIQRNFQGGCKLLKGIDVGNRETILDPAGIGADKARLALDIALRQMLRFAQCSYPCADFHPM